MVSLEVTQSSSCNAQAKKPTCKTQTFASQFLMLVYPCWIGLSLCEPVWNVCGAWKVGYAYWWYWLLVCYLLSSDLTRSLPCLLCMGGFYSLAYIHRKFGYIPFIVIILVLIALHLDFLIIFRVLEQWPSCLDSLALPHFILYQHYWELSHEVYIMCGLATW